MIATLAAIAGSSALGFAALLFHIAWMHRLVGHIEGLERRHGPGLILSVLVGGTLATHGLQILAYGFAFWAGEAMLGAEPIEGGAGQIRFDEALYFSVVCYSSLGFGDLVPHGRLRLLAGTEALTGLLAVAWTASVGFIVLQRRGVWTRPRAGAASRDEASRGDATRGTDATRGFVRRRRPLSGGRR